MLALGGFKQGISSSEKIKTISTKVAPEGFSWAVLAIDRDVGREIRANLQSTLNASVNLPYTAPFLNDLKVSETTFTIILRWTSFTLKIAFETKPDASKTGNSSDLGDYFISSLTSQAWIIGIWQVEKVHIAEAAEFRTLRDAIVKRFSEPQEIEQGCDYLVKVTNPSVKDKKLYTRFKLYGSDGTEVNEISLHHDWTAFNKAFDAISRRQRLRSINYLNISGQIDPLGKSKPPQLNERVLLQMQEARAMILSLKAKGQSANSVEDKLQVSSDASLFGSTPFDTSIFVDLDKLDADLSKKGSDGARK